MTSATPTRAQTPAARSPKLSDLDLREEQRQQSEADDDLDGSRT